MLGDVMGRTREWMAPNVYYSRIHSSSLPLWRGALRVGEARLREGKVRRLHCAGQQQTTARLSRARSYVLLSIVSSHRRTLGYARPPHSRWPPTEDRV
jgi:hypothetical protein